MNAFEPIPPDWTHSAIHAINFRCPTCQGNCVEAEQVWINRRSPVYTELHQRKWQEFYQCGCGGVWWAWSTDRPLSNFARRDDVE
jgi:hypothetical protein